MTPASPDANPRSAIARLQGLLVLGALGLLGVGAVLAWRGSVFAGLGLLFLVTAGHAVVLALEFVFAAQQHRHSAGAPMAASVWCRAWWGESWIAPQVFAWRQPFRWRRWPDTDVPPPNAATGAGPAVFIHGFVCNRGFWLPWLKAMRARGLSYTTVNLEPVFGSIDDYVPLIEQAVRRAERLGLGRPTLICHSMGGLAARAWLADGDGQGSRIQRVITIGSPHRGTWLGRFSRVANGRQMREDASWLGELAQREQERRPDAAYARFVCWYADTDNIVFPALTATLPGADNRLVHGAAHVDLGFHPRVMRESLAMLASGGSSPIERTAS